MQHATESRNDPWSLWCSAPWYEKLGMVIFLGAHAYLFVRVFIG